jgi:hypothetical protein
LNIIFSFIAYNLFVNIVKKIEIKFNIIYILK